MSRSCCARFATAQTKTHWRSLRFLARSQRNKGRLCTRAPRLTVALTPHFSGLPSCTSTWSLLEIRCACAHRRLVHQDSRIVGARAAWRRHVVLEGSPRSAEDSATSDTCRSCERDRSHAGCAKSAMCKVVCLHLQPNRARVRAQAWACNLGGHEAPAKPFISFKYSRDANSCA